MRFVDMIPCAPELQGAQRLQDWTNFEYEEYASTPLLYKTTWSTVYYFSSINTQNINLKQHSSSFRDRFSICSDVESL